MRHGFPYSGHASACAAGMTNLDIDTIVFCPPLVIPDEQVDRIVGATAKATIG